jgi:hypothetical protein
MNKNVIKCAIVVVASIVSTLGDDSILPVETPEPFWPSPTLTIAPDSHRLSPVEEARIFGNSDLFPIENRLPPIAPPLELNQQDLPPGVLSAISSSPLSLGEVSAAAALSGPQSVPEPSTIALMAIACGCWLARVTLRKVLQIKRIAMIAS